jgi:hypothetical protein
MCHNCAWRDTYHRQPLYSRSFDLSYRLISIYTMPPKARSSSAKSKPKSALPDVPWNANEHYLTWALIAEMEKNTNAKVLFGKEKNEVRKY